MNKVILLGRLTRDPEIRYTAGSEQKAIAKFTLAVDRRYKREGEQTADFINCTAFGKVADFINKYFRKGSKALVEGHWQTGSYTDKSGGKVYTNDCIIESIEFGEGKKDGSQGQAPEPQADSDGFMHVPDGIQEDLPFN